MKPKRLLRMLVLVAACVVLAATSGLAQGFRTQQLLLDDDAGSLATRNTITLLSPSDGNLTSDYDLRLPNSTDLGVGSMMFVGATGATNDLSWLAIGAQDQVLQVSAGGVPTWQTINLIPDGTVDNSTLRWDAATSSWVENTELTSDASGNTVINGTTITTPNIPGGAATETDVVVRNASNELVVRTIDDLIGDATLSENAIWVGDANNNPGEVAAGTTDQVLQISAAGVPTWQDINLLPTGTVDNTTLRWDATTSTWQENTELTSDASGNTDVNGTMTINGATTTVNSATVSVPNIPANATNETTVIVSNGGDMETRTIDDLLSDATLSENAIWVGDASNNPSEVAAGTTDQVLQVSAAGVPTWQTINLIPDGTVDNTTLRWDAATSSWVENTNLTSDATGNTVVNGTTVSVPNIPANATNETTVIVSNGGDMETRTIDDLLSDATLSENAIWVGDASNNPSEVAAGTTDQVLQVSAAGVPTWQTINLIPDGTVDNTTLRWDAATSSWVENTNLTSDATGNTVVNGTTVSVPNIPANATNETTVIVSNGGDMETRTIDDLLSDATLSENAIWVGDASNNPSEVAAGTTDQVLQVSAAGVPTWQTINLIPDGTVDNTTLRWDAATSSWVENTELTSDASGNTDVNGTMTINGATTTVNSATVSVPNIPANATNETTVIVSNGGDMETRTIDDLLSDATLSENAIWVGDASNNPSEVAAGTTDQVLQVSAAGVPTWQTINLIPDGTVDNTTLRWDAATSSWVENTNLTSDATGNTVVNGTTVSVPNIPANATNETTVIVSNGGDMETRTIDDLIGDATLSENAIWVGDVNNNPTEVAAGTQNQVLQIDATGAPTWQTVNLVYRGRVATTGGLSQTIADANVTATSTIIVQYEDPANGARIALDVTGRNNGTDFTVAFSALPANNTFINYTIMP